MASQVEWWRRVTATPLSMSSTNVNLTDTLPVMEGRKSLRRFRGAYQRTRPVLAWFMFLLLLTIWTFTSSSFDGSTASPGPLTPSPLGKQAHCPLSPPRHHAHSPLEAALLRQQTGLLTRLPLWRPAAGVCHVLAACGRVH